MSSGPLAHPHPGLAPAAASSAVSPPPAVGAGAARAGPAAAGVRLDALVVALVVACAAALYFWRLDQPPAYIYDEVYHAYTAAQLAAGNADAYLWNTSVPEADRARGVAYEWVHPALAKLPMQAGVRLWGDTPFGWRFASAVFGAAGVGLLYLLGRTLFDRTVALLAAALLLLDGLWFVQARTAMNDVFVVCFLLLAYLLFARYLRSAPGRRGRPLWLCGLALGLAVATKWSAVYSLGLLAVVAAGREAWLLRTGAERSAVRALLTPVAVFVAVPAAVYLGGYAQFFLMGHTLAEWRELQGQIWRYHSTLAACHDWASPAWTWPFLLRPVWYHTAGFADGTVANVFAMGNPLLWWAFPSAVAVAGVLWAAGRFRALGLGLLLLGFLGQWAPWLGSPRIAYLQHMLPSLPFACLAVGYLLGRGWRGWRGRARPLVAAYLACAALAFLFFYSHYAAVPVSAEYTRLHYWLPTWQPGAPWAFGCPAGPGR